MITVLGRTMKVVRHKSQEPVRIRTIYWDWYEAHRDGRNTMRKNMQVYIFRTFLKQTNHHCNVSTHPHLSRPGSESVSPVMFSQYISAGFLFDSYISLELDRFDRRTRA